jgi:hypothetical protein
MEKPIKCPCCDSILAVTHQERYQDLCEHVSDPNGTPSMKNGYQCPNTKCIANQCNVSWIEDGDYYKGSCPEGITWKQLNSALNARYGTAYAVDSWNFHYELGKRAIEKRSLKINLYWYKFNIIPKEKGWKYEIEERHQPHLWKKKIEIWKKSSDYGYTNVIPFWRMTAFCLSQFKGTYRAWKENGNKSSLKTAYCTAHSLSEWRMDPDTRFYSRLAGLIIRTFYPGKVKELNNGIKIVNNF